MLASKPYAKTNPKLWRATDVNAHLPEPRTTARGRRVDEATRLSLLTPEERAELQRQQEERERRYQEEVRLRRMEIESNFQHEYDSQRYVMRWAGTGNIGYEAIDYRTFFDVPHTPLTPPQQTETSLPERFNAAVIEADRCARRGDTLGRVAATRMANRLRREIIQQSLSTI